MSRILPPLFSRLLTILVALGCVGAALWMGYAFLQPIPIPPLPPSRAAVRFDARVDVSKNAVFQHLEPVGLEPLSLDGLGRLNPFAPLPVISLTTTSVTSTLEGVTTTSEIPVLIPAN